MISIKDKNEMKQFAASLVALVQAGDLVLLNGDLGAGKTTFTQFIGEALGVKRTINSPTFNIMKEYKYPNGKLYHIDAYRLEDSDEDLGFEDIFFEDNVSVIEWGEFIEDFIPKERLIFNIRLVDDHREVEIISNGEYEKIEERIRENW